MVPEVYPIVDKSSGEILGISIGLVSFSIRLLNASAPCGALPNEIRVLTLVSFLMFIIDCTLSEDVIIALALQSFTTCFISDGVSIVFTGFIIAPILAILK